VWSAGAGKASVEVGEAGQVQIHAFPGAEEVGPKQAEKARDLRNVVSVRYHSSPMTETGPIFPVCPLCRKHLEWNSESIACRHCGASFSYENRIPNLIVGERFDDDDDRARSEYEVLSNEHLSREYLIPTFRRLFPGRERPKVLSLGCGVGTDIDLLTEAGFDIVGIDCGNRSRLWPERKHWSHLFLANGKCLPFEDQTFDLAYCGCVFPHVGVEGDSNRVVPNYREERMKIAREMTRVIKPQGYIMVSSPNRKFPVDLFHGRSPEQPIPRLNPPWNPFLLSAGDYERMFSEAGCQNARTLPVKGYWGFVRMKQSWKGRMMAFPIDTVFSMVSNPGLGFLRGSIVNPWLAMLFRRSGGFQLGSW